MSKPSVPIITLASMKNHIENTVTTLYIGANDRYCVRLKFKGPKFMSEYHEHDSFYDALQNYNRLVEEEIDKMATAHDSEGIK